MTPGELVAVLKRYAVSVLEPQKGEWVNNNVWGDQRFQPLPQTAGQVISVLPKNTSLYGPPAVHSVQLGRSDDVDAENADVYARVTLGCGGVENNFDCDWLHGAQFTVVCNSLSVQAVSYAPISGVAYNAAAASVALKVMTAKGSTNPSRCPLTLTEPNIVLVAAPDPASFVVYTFPDFAREFTAHVADNNDPAVPTNVAVTFFNQGAQALAVYDAQVFAGGRSVPIPGGANTVRLSNGSGGPLSITAQWFLGL